MAYFYYIWANVQIKFQSHKSGKFVLEYLSIGKTPLIVHTLEQFLEIGTHFVLIFIEFDG